MMIEFYGLEENFEIMDQTTNKIIRFNDQVCYNQNGDVFSAAQPGACSVKLKV